MFDGKEDFDKNQKIQDALTVTGGTVKGRRRVAPAEYDRWIVRIKPSGPGDVTVTLPATTGGCTAAGAICTPDGKALSNAPNVTIQGPPGLAVADAEVQEGPNAALGFVVTLSRAATGAVSVQYATADGSARALPGLRDHRISRVFRPLEEQVVAAAGEAEAVRIAVVDQGRDPFLVDKSPAAEAADAVRSVILRRQRHRMVDPVHEVGAGGVPPLDAVPVGSVRVELVKDVVAPLPVDGAVDVVHPGGGRGEVPGRPVRIAGEGGSEIAGLPDPRFHPINPVFSSHGDSRRLLPGVPGMSDIPVLFRDDSKPGRTLSRR